MEKFLVLVAGPTAVGKTSMAIRLARHFRTEIISADARQVYTEMTIGTAVPSPSERQMVPHHLVGHHSVHAAYDAAGFASDARIILDHLFQKHQVVVLCGGSGLYIRALLDGLDEMPEIPDSIRTDLGHEFEQNGLGWLQQEVRDSDPELFECVDRQNPRRLLRALEVFRHTGKPLSSFQNQTKAVHPFKIIRTALYRPRTDLYAEIDRRVDRMLVEGLWEEAEQLYPLRHLQALQTVGYQEIFDHLEGNISREEAIRQIKRNTRHYAKRQMTWFRQDERIRWFDWNDERALTGFLDHTVQSV